MVTVTSSTCSAPRERCRVREVNGATYAPAPFRKRFTSFSPVAATQWGSSTCRLPMRGSNSGAYNSSKSAACGIGLLLRNRKLVRNHLREDRALQPQFHLLFELQQIALVILAHFPGGSWTVRAKGKRAPGRNRFHGNNHQRRGALPHGRTDSQRPACAGRAPFGRPIARPRPPVAPGFRWRGRRSW